MASSEILSQTLHSITSIKLDQLAKQRAGYESAKRALLDDAAYETEARKRAKILVDGAEKLPTMTSLRESPMISLHNFGRFVQQAQYDPTVSEAFLLDYEETMRNELDVQSAKYRFADLYGKLVKEWIAAGKEGKGRDRDRDHDGESDSDDTASVSSEFFPVGREEMHQQRATWEAYVFHAKLTDAAAIRTYLDGLFGSGATKDVQEAFRRLRESLESFQKYWNNFEHFDEQSLTNGIRGLLRTDLLTDEKRKMLHDFLNNRVVLREIADVLNMRMQTRATWEWSGVNTIDQRRQLNGRYRFYPDEDLLQMLFLYTIGMKWGVEIRQRFEEFLKRDGVKKPAAKPMSKQDVRRRRFFLNQPNATIDRADAVDAKLEAHWAGQILLDQLPKTMHEERGSYGDDGELRSGDSRKSHTAVVQDLLHLLQSKIILDTRLGKDLTVIRSDFKWFGPSLPHSTILAVLDFLGVRAEWLDFFQRVLEAPIRFKQDPVDAPAQVRVRGTPVSTPIADFFAESILFCLDFTVNQKADGARLYRLHDDMWLWGSAETCQLAWGSMTEFATLMGLEFNSDKTGSVRIRRDGSTAPPTVPKGLPRGDVVWGFLKLDPLTGRFDLDQKKVDDHIAELRLQLDACRSIFDWIQAWNIYGSRFFSTNFGKLANCYPREHVDTMLATFSRIQEALFGCGGSVGTHLRGMISRRFGDGQNLDIPEGWLYFPIARGGLGLQNPFINLYLVRERVNADPYKAVDEFLEAEAAEYRRFKASFEAYEGRGDGGTIMLGQPWRREYADLKDQPFFSMEEFTRYRERTSVSFGNLLDRLRKVPDPQPVELKGELHAVLGSAVGWDSGDWESLSPYDQWVCSLYAKDMIARFGSVTIVDRGLLPMGLMDMLRQSRFKWQG